MFCRRNSPWATYGKFSQINAPGPAMLWVLVDENVQGLNDAAFGFEMAGAEAGGPAWIDAPGAYHNGGCGFAFADGHSETHQWRAPKTYSYGAKQLEPGDTADLQDWTWMQQRTSALVQ